MNPNNKASAAKPSAKTDQLAALLEEPSLPAWYRRPWSIATMFVSLLLLAALAYWLRPTAKLPSYSTHTVGFGDLSLAVNANGSLQPTRAMNIGSELSGTVLKVNVDVNDRIKKGQLLVQLDPAKLQGQILRSQALLASAKAKLSQAIASQLESEANMARQQLLSRISGKQLPARSEFDAAIANLSRSQAEQLAARAGVQDASAALATDQINLSKAAIRAPADGVVLTRNVDPGNAVAASLQAVTLLTVAEDLSHLRLWVYVDEADIANVQIEQKASFTVSAYPNRHFPAIVTRVGFGSTITDNVVTYLTYLDVSNHDLSLRPGMTASATIIATQHHHVLLVPNSALRFSPNLIGLEQAKAGFFGSLFTRRQEANPRKSAAQDASTANARKLWVLDGKGLAREVAVMPGLSDGRMTEIISGQLQAGMRVITDQKTVAKK